MKTQRTSQLVACFNPARCIPLIGTVVLILFLGENIVLQAQERVKSCTFNLEQGTELEMTISGLGLLNGVENSKQVSVIGTVEADIHLDASDSISKIRLKTIQIQPVEASIQYALPILFATATIQMTDLQLMMLEENAGPVSAVVENGTFTQPGNQLSAAGHVRYEAGFLLNGSTNFDPDDLFEHDIEGVVSGNPNEPTVEFPILIRRTITSDDTELAEFVVQGALKASKASGSTPPPSVNFTIEPLPEDPGKLLLRWPAEANGTLSIANDIEFNNPEILDIANLGGTFTVDKDPGLPMQFFKLTIQ